MMSSSHLRRIFQVEKRLPPAEGEQAGFTFFVNHNRYLARHDNANDSNVNGDDETIRDITSLLATVGIDEADSAAMVAAKAREVLLLELAKNVKMARVQQLLYQQKVVVAVKDAVDGVNHSSCTYTFVVDYGQNMSLKLRE